MGWKVCPSNSNVTHAPLTCPSHVPFVGDPLDGEPPVAILELNAVIDKESSATAFIKRESARDFQIETTPKSWSSEQQPEWSPPVEAVSTQPYMMPVPGSPNAAHRIKRCMH